MSVEFDIEGEARLGMARDRAAGAAPRRAALILGGFAASRLALLVVGLLTQILIQPHSTFTHAWSFSHQAGLNMWGVWDSDWYRLIAEKGYDSHVHADGYATWAFFPAYPMLSGALARITHLPLFWCMLAISNLSFIAALFLIHREAADEFDRPTADLAVILFCVVPGSYVFSSAYTESLFLLATAASLVLMRRRRWLAAGAFAALATLTRNLGVGLALPMAFLAAPHLASFAGIRLGRNPAAERAGAGEAARIVIALALPVAAIAAFAALLYSKTGDPLAFITAQKGWHRSVGNPLGTLVTYLVQPRLLLNEDLVSYPFAWLAAGLLVVLVVMRRWTLALLGGFFVLVALAAGVASYQRYCMIMIPLFLAGAKILAERPTAERVVVPSLAILNGFMMVAWTLGMVVAA